MQQSQPMRLCIHGHFYQPPRENPWTGFVEAQESAVPHHDWNERISRECYAPNGASRLLDAKGRIRGLVNNYRWISFNFGPTLLEWMDRHDPETLERIREADRLSVQDQNGHGNAIAQVYNHVIMPLGTDRDRRTQIAWGLREFQDRFGRAAEGMWLAETAIDMATVVALIEAGVLFTILAPSQAERVRDFGADTWRDVSDNSIDPSRPYRIYPVDAQGEPLCAGHLDVFFYDGPISSAVGFEHLLRDAGTYLARLQGAWDPHDPNPRLVAVGTDGESYGHHEPFGDMALAYLFDTLAPQSGIVPTNFGHFLSIRPPREEVRLKNAYDEGTAWSCAHGTGRWKRDCGCSTGGRGDWNQLWRGPLREAMDLARASAERCWDALSPSLFDDPWRARVAWISTRTGACTREQWGREHLRPGRADQLPDALTLMELVRMGQFCLTSCAWFFDDLGGLEPVQNMRYAWRVCELLATLGQPSPESQLRAILARASSNVEARSGDWIWNNWVKPPIDPLRKVAAQALLRHRGGDESSRDDAQRIFDHSTPSPGFVRATVAWEDPVSSRALVFRCLARSVLGESCRAWVLEGAGDDPIPSTAIDSSTPASRIDASWGGPAITAGELDLDTRRELAEQRVQQAMQEVRGDLETLDAHASKARCDLQALHISVPGHLSLARRVLMEDALASGILQVLEEPSAGVVADVRTHLETARDEGIDLRITLPGRQFDRHLQGLMPRIASSPRRTEVDTLVLLLDLAEETGIPVSKAPLENLAWRIREERLHPLLRQPNRSDLEHLHAALWVDVLERLNFDMDLERELLGLPAQVDLVATRKGEA